VIWTTHPDQVPFWFMDGAIQTKNPDRSAIQKMVELARKLNAKVLGEGDEEYGPDGELGDGKGGRSSFQSQHPTP
jgi:hypothetical protein